MEYRIPTLTLIPIQGSINFDYHTLEKCPKNGLKNCNFCLKTRRTEHRSACGTLESETLRVLDEINATIIEIRKLMGS
uniref:Uncharacterized protein n=1 Tax=Romanomermis culicivorax TaxID=13658 RepID=A0A915ICD6_ROMCU